MADSVQWLSQSDYTICILLLISNGFDQFYRLNTPGTALYKSRIYAIFENDSHSLVWGYTNCNKIPIIYLKSNPRIRRKNIIKQLHSSLCHRHLETTVQSSTAVSS